MKTIAIIVEGDFMERKVWKQLFWLFYINLIISAFTFGGGYIVITMIRKYFVEEKALFKEEELLEMSAVAQSSPGAIAINFSALAGYKVAGFKGALISCIGAVIPPFLLLSLISYYYTLFSQNTLIRACLKGMEAGVALLIVDVVISMTRVIIKQKQHFFTLLIPLSFVLSFLLNVNVLFIVVGSALMSFGYCYWEMRNL